MNKLKEYAAILLTLLSLVIIVGGGYTYTHTEFALAKDFNDLKDSVKCITMNGSFNSISDRMLRLEDKYGEDLLIKQTVDPTIKQEYRKLQNNKKKLETKLDRCGDE